MSGSQIDGNLGTTLFSDLSNDIFIGLRSIKENIRIELLNGFLSVPDMIKRIDYIILETNPVSINVAQTTGNSSVKIHGIKANISGKADGDDFPIICTSVNFKAELRFTGSGSFDKTTLNIVDMTFDVNNTVLSASCSGVFGFIGDLLFNIMHTQTMENLIETRMRELLEEFGGFQSIPSMFSLSDIEFVVSTGIGSNPTIAKVRSVINEFLLPQIGNDGIELKIELHPDIFGENNNLMNIEGAHQKVKFLIADNIVSQFITRIRFSNFGGEIYKIYSKKPNKSWFHLVTINDISPLFGVNVPLLPVDTEIMVVAHNGKIDDLRSFRETTFVIEQGAGGAPCRLPPC